MPPTSNTAHQAISLAETQQDIMQALLEPIFGHSRSLTELPHRDGSVSKKFQATADKLITPSPLLKPVERLELYHRQYWYRLLDTIAEDFDALLKLIGKDAFWNLMECYLEARPSQHFSMAFLAEKLSHFISSSPHILGNLTTHAAELAHIEYAMLTAFTQAHHPTISIDEMLGRDDIKINLQPHLHLFSLHTKVKKMLGSDSPPAPTDEILAAPTAQPSEFLAVYRSADSVFYTSLDQREFTALSAIQQGSSIVEAISDIAWPEDADPDLCSQQISTWFQGWTSRQWLCSTLSPHRSNP